MTETELELFRLRARVVIVERLVLKQAVSQLLALNVPIDQAIDAVKQTVQVDDATVSALTKGQPAEYVGLYDAELREISERLHDYLEELRPEAK